MFVKLKFYCVLLKRTKKSKRIRTLLFSWSRYGNMFRALSRTYGICVITSVSSCADKMKLAEGINALHTF